jgi:hypothetical protein
MLNRRDRLPPIVTRPYMKRSGVRRSDRGAAPVQRHAPLREVVLLLEPPVLVGARQLLEGRHDSSELCNRLLLGRAALSNCA